jgi:hypothetical protein
MADFFLGVEDYRRSGLPFIDREIICQAIHPVVTSPVHFEAVAPMLNLDPAAVTSFRRTYGI